jgi:hypothetical protein
MRDPTCPLRLDQLARPAPYVGVGGDPTREIDARRVVVSGEALDDQVWEQRLFMQQ